MGWILPLLLVVPQGGVATPPALEMPVGLVVTEGPGPAGLPLASLGLGDGGTGTKGVPGRPLQRGQHQTVGGVLVETHESGVKLAFPSGAEAMLSRDGGLHLRTGERAEPLFNSIELLLGDGSAVRIQTRPRLRRVEVREGGSGILLWDRRRPRRERARERRFAGQQILVLGDGDVFYRASLMGPLIAMERVLCPERRQEDFPRRFLVILGHPLRASLRQLPGRFPSRAIDYPDAAGIGLELAQRAADVFPAGSHPLRRAAGDLLRMTTGSDFELSLHLPDVGPAVLSLHRGDENRTLVEWTIGFATELRMVRPDGGSGEGPRYYKSGLPVAGFDELVSLSGSRPDWSLGRRILRALGAVPMATPVAPKIGG